MAVTLPYGRVVNVTLTRADRFPTTRGFNTALLLSSTSLAGKVDASNRTRLYGDITELAVEWPSTSEVYKSAAIFFASPVRPPQLKVGYRNPANPMAAEMDLIRNADPDWYWLNHTNELNDTAAQRDLADWAESRTVIGGLDSNDVDTETATGVDDPTATVTITVASPGVITWTGHGLSAGDPVRFTTTGSLPTGLTAGTTYYVLSSGLTTNSFSVGATAGGSAIATTGTQSGTHTGTALRYGGSIAEYVQSKSYDRSPVFYHTDPASYLAAGAWGYASGRDLDRSNYRLATRGRIDSGQSYTLKFKRFPGVQPINKPSAAVQAITGFVPGLGLSNTAGHFANTYVDIGGLPMLVEGSVPSGAFIDEIHASDWLVARMQESVLGVFANNAVVPYTNQGVGLLIEGGVQPPLRRAFAAGIIAPREGDSGDFLPAYEIAVDDVANIPVSQRRQRIAPDIKVTFRFSGALHYATVSMTLQY